MKSLINTIIIFCTFLLWGSLLLFGHIAYDSYQGSHVENCWYIAAKIGVSDTLAAGLLMIFICSFLIILIITAIFVQIELIKQVRE